jgi:nucleoside-diphosphate-sugar epimerase
MHKHVLVTGGSGFTGSHLCNRLVAEGYCVRTLVRDPARAMALLHKDVELIQGDLRERSKLDEATAGVDTVYHIAALFRQENVSRQEMWQTNVEGTRHLLDAAIQARVQRFVHCSTIGVHGDVKNPPATEETPYAPGDYYQESKTEGEQLVLQYMKEGRLPISVFRPGGIYGPGDLRFLKLFKGIKKGRFVMLGSGEIQYQLVYIDDLVDGILLCGTREEALDNVYILTGSEPTTLNQLVQAIACAVGVPPPRLRFPVTPVYLAGLLCEIVCKPFGINPPLYRRRVDFFRKNRAFSIEKAERQLNFQPKVSLEEGLRQTAGWYMAQGLL